MSKILDDSIELARWFDPDGIERKITIKQYHDLVIAKDKDKISDFIFQRLFTRYLKPFQFTSSEYKSQFKNGFSIMANCCLLIETVQSFKNGWGDSDKKSSQAFKQFLSTEASFLPFKGKEHEFYVNVRCGILHQGETTGGWTINRNGSNLFDVKTRAVDSVVFAKELEQCLKDYSESLRIEEWDSIIWDNFRVKMRKIISNCEK